MMKRIWLCLILFIGVFVFCFFCEHDVNGYIKDTVELLEKSRDSRMNGDLELSRKYNADMLKKWEIITKKSPYCLADLTLFTEAGISVARTNVLSSYDDDMKFYEECEVAILMLKNFLEDNKLLHR